MGFHHPLRKGQTNSTQKERFEKFCLENAGWLDDYALFMALKELNQDEDGGVWNRWPKEIALRQPDAMQEWSGHLHQ